MTYPEALPVSTVMLLVPCPEINCHPVGIDHVYCVAPVMDGTEYVVVVPGARHANPEMLMPVVLGVLLRFTQLV